MTRWVAITGTLVTLAALEARADVVIVYAAGSLREPITALAQDFVRRGVDTVSPTFGASGTLRDRIAGGADVDVFASANLEHPQSLVKSGWATEAKPFARNRMCALVSPRVDATPETLLDVMLARSVKVGSSTPKADPAGDYAWEIFRRADAVHPGAFATLSRKALKLTGGPPSPTPPGDRNLYGILVAKGDADVFLTYCTNAKLAFAEEPSLRIVTLPPELAVDAVYGIAVRRDADPAARDFAAYVLSPDGQKQLERFGFDPP